MCFVWCSQLVGLAICVRCFKTVFNNKSVVCTTGCYHELLLSSHAGDIPEKASKTFIKHCRWQLRNWSVGNEGGRDEEGCVCVCVCVCVFFFLLRYFPMNNSGFIAEVYMVGWAIKHADFCITWRPSSPHCHIHLILPVTSISSFLSQLILPVKILAVHSSLGQDMLCRKHLSQLQMVQFFNTVWLFERAACHVIAVLLVAPL